MAAAAPRATPTSILGIGHAHIHIRNCVTQPHYVITQLRPSLATPPPRSRGSGPGSPKFRDPPRHGGGRAPPPGAAGERPPSGAGQGVPVARGPARGAPALGLLPGPAAFRGPAGFRGALAAPGAQRGEVPEQLRAAVPGAGGLLPGHLPPAPPRSRGFRRGRRGREGAGPGGATGVTGPGAQPRPPAGRGRRGFPAPVLAGGGGVSRVLGAGSRPGVFGVARGVPGAGPARAGDGARVTQNHQNSPQKNPWDPKKSLGPLSWRWSPCDPKWPKFTPK